MKPPKGVLVKGGRIFVRLYMNGKEVRLGPFASIKGASSFRSQCKREMNNCRFYPEYYKKVGFIGGLPVCAAKLIYNKARREHLQWLKNLAEIRKTRLLLKELSRRSREA